MAADGIVFLTADFTAAAGTQTTATVERGLSATGPWVFLDNVALLNQVGVYYDTSAPLDTPVWYRWTGLPAATIVQGPFTEVSDGTVLLKDPLRPWANLAFSFCETMQQAINDICAPSGPQLIWGPWGDATRAVDATLPELYGAERPADVYGRRKNREASFTFLSKTLAARDQVHALFTAGGPLQMQAPLVYGWEDCFVQPFDLNETWIHPDQRKPYRLWSAPFRIVDRPIGPAQGTACANWCAVSAAYPTYGALAATGFTWAQVAAGAAGGAGC